MENQYSTPVQTLSSWQASMQALMSGWVVDSIKVPGTKVLHRISKSVPELEPMEKEVRSSREHWMSDEVAVPVGVRLGEVGVAVEG